MQRGRAGNQCFNGNRPGSSPIAGGSEVIEPLFPFKSAIEQIPMRNIQELYNFLNKHPEIEPVYSRTRNTKSPRWGYEEGFLTESQIKEIRRLRFHSFEESRFAKGGRPRGRCKTMTGRARPLPRSSADCSPTSGSSASCETVIRGPDVADRRDRRGRRS